MNHRVVSVILQAMFLAEANLIMTSILNSVLGKWTLTKAKFLMYRYREQPLKLDFCALKTGYVQTIARSNNPLSKLSCVQKRLCQDCRVFIKGYVQTMVRSEEAISRLSDVQKTLCPDYREFEVQKCLCPDFLVFLNVSRSFNFQRH